MPALGRAGIVVVNHAERDRAQRRWQEFEQQVRPLLVPVGLDPPIRSRRSRTSRSTSSSARRQGRVRAREPGRDRQGAARVAAVIRLPDKISGGRQAFVLLTSVIRAHLEELFQAGASKRSRSSA